MLPGNRCLQNVEIFFLRQYVQPCLLKNHKYTFYTIKSSLKLAYQRIITKYFKMKLFYTLIVYYIKSILFMNTLFFFKGFCLPIVICLNIFLIVQCIWNTNFCKKWIKYLPFLLIHVDYFSCVTIITHNMFTTLF